MNKITTATLDRLRVYVYHPRYSSDGELVLRLASAFLGRMLRHGALDTLTEQEGQSLLAHFDKTLVDRTEAVVEAVVTDFKRQ